MRICKGSAVLEGLTTPPFKDGDYYANINHQYDIKWLYDFMISVSRREVYEDYTLLLRELHSTVTRTTLYCYENYTLPLRELHSTVTRTTLYCYENYTLPLRELHSTVTRTTLYRYENYTLPLRGLHSTVTRTTLYRYEDYTLLLRSKYFLTFQDNLLVSSFQETQ